MKFISEKIKSLFFANQPHYQNPMLASQPFDFVRMRKAILRELIISKQTKNVVGVYCKALGEGMFLTAVEEIEPTTRGEVIVFHRLDISGKVLLRAKVDLDEIEMVCPFNRPYQAPSTANNPKTKQYAVSV